MARRATSETMKMLPEAGPRPFDPGIFQAGRTTLVGRGREAVQLRGPAGPQQTEGARSCTVLSHGSALHCPWLKLTPMT